MTALLDGIFAHELVGGWVAEADPAIASCRCYPASPAKAFGSFCRFRRLNHPWGQMMRSLIALLLLQLCACQGKNGWDEAAVTKSLTATCMEDAAVFSKEAAKPKDFDTRFQQACVEVLAAAIRPCQLEYKAGTDSAMKCVDERFKPAHAQFLDEVFARLHPTDTTMP